MNLAHLRKQAKNLKSFYPKLVAEHGTSIALSGAQEAIARTHGFPSWSTAVSKAAADDKAMLSNPIKNGSVGIAGLVHDGYEFAASEETSLGIALDDNGEPTRWSTGREVMLCIRHRRDQAQVDSEERAMDALVERAGGFSGSFDEYSPESLSIMLTQARDAVARCPLYLEGWNRIAGTLWTQKKFTDGVEVAEPVVTSLLALLPTEGVVQVSYGHLNNRPFFRLVHCYLLLLHELGRHREADSLADRMYKLWPMDNIGFRFLLNRADRDAA